MTSRENGPYDTTPRGGPEPRESGPYGRDPRAGRPYTGRRGTGSGAGTGTGTWAGTGTGSGSAVGTGSGIGGGAGSGTGTGTGTWAGTGMGTASGTGAGRTHETAAREQDGHRAPDGEAAESGCPVRHDTTPPAPAVLVPGPTGGRRPGPGGPGPMALTDIVSAPDPHRVYRELRERYGPVAPVELEPGLPAWLVLGYHELLAVTRQEQLFSRDPRNWHALRENRVAADSPLMPMMRYYPVCYHADGAEHRRMRVPFDEGMGRLNGREARRLIEGRCQGLVAKFSEAGHADLVNEYAAQVPMMSLAGLFGLGPALSEELVRTVFGVVGSGPDSEDSYQVQHRIIGEMLARPPANLDEDMTWTFAHHPNLLTDAERYAAMHLMLIAGNMPTISWIAQTLQMMITDPRFAARLRGGRLGVDDALDEALWREPPLNAMPARYVLHDIELGGQVLRRGDCLIMGIGAANDDPEIRPDEGEDWGNQAHLAFSAGPHRCPAQLPARLIARTAVRTVLNLLPDLELTVPAADLAPSPSPWTRVPARLPVSFTPRRLPTEPGSYADAPVE
ncbi:cytochrome P450 [Streptomyces sp. DW26H14]|uniref:cytochrome P450 n=1 Tax=Streptomyces sp. DW26H14 TaxID=3435395 RepID=UPI00403DB223